MSEYTRMTTFAELMQRGVLEIGDGYRAKLEELGGTGPIFLRAGLLTDRGFDWAAAERFRDDCSGNLRSKFGRPGDTMVTTKGNSVGRTGFVADNSPDFVYSPHLSYWRSLDRGRLAPGFLRYWSRSPEFLAQLRSMANSTDMAPYLSLSDQRRLQVSLPGIDAQEAIAKVLGALDDKIVVNNRIVRVCDELRALRFRGWVQSRGDLIHERPLSSMASFVNGRAFTKGATGTGRMVIRIAEINSGPSASTVYNDIDVAGEHLAHPGDVLFAWSGSLAVARWFRETGIINQHIFKVIPNSKVPEWLAFELINEKLAMFKGIAADKATTMGHIQRRHLDEVVSVPSPSGIAQLDVELGPLWERALSAEQESLKLAELRDMLVPKLMSGEIRVREAERVVEDVT